MSDDIAGDAAPAAVATEPVAPTAYDPVADEAAAIAAYRDEVAKNAGTTVATPKPTETVVPDPAVEPVKTETVADPADAKIEKLFSRVSSMEAERAAEKAAHESLTAENAELKGLFAEFHKNPDALFKKVGWSQETIRDYILGGSAAPLPALSAVEQKYEAKLKELESRIEAAQKASEAEKDETVKSTIPSLITETSFPHMSAFFESPAAAAEHVWGLIEHARRVQKVRLTPDEAASAVERQLVKQAERLSRVSKPSTPAGSAAAPVSKLPTPKPTSATSQTSTTAPYNPEEHSDEENLAHANAIIRAARNK